MRFNTYVNGSYGFNGINAAGGLLPLPLKLMVAPTDPMEAVNRGYVDTAAGSFSGGGVTGVFAAARLPSYTGSDINSAGGGVFNLTATGVTAGSYGKVTVDVKGRVVGGGTLMSSDIPSLSWGKLVDRPTTLSGYGITDVVSLSGATMTGPLSLNNAPIASGELANKAYVDARVGVSGGSAFVTGDIISRSSPTTPAGYLRCNGGEVSKTTYAGLFAVLGDNHIYTEVPGIQVGSGQPWRQQYDINKSQNGDIIGWTSTTPLPDIIGHGQVLVTKNMVYLYGGIFSQTSAKMAPIDSNGVIGAWVSAPSIPSGQGAYYSQIVVVRNKAYHIGSHSGSSNLNAYVSNIDSNGLLSGWTAVPVPAYFQSHNCVVTSTRLYVLDTNANDVYADINQDGTLGAWISIPVAAGFISNAQMVVVKNRVYRIGGFNGTNSVSNVYMATISSTGIIGGFVEVTPLPEVCGNSHSFCTRNRVYILSGSNFSKVYSAAINVDGTLGTWQLNTSLPATINGSHLVITSSRIYLLGGYVNGSRSSSVYYASITGGLNDYSDVYGNVFPATDSANFRIPDTTLDDLVGSYSYIKT